LLYGQVLYPPELTGGACQKIANVAKKLLEKLSATRPQPLKHRCAIPVRVHGACRARRVPRAQPIAVAAGYPAAWLNAKVAVTMRIAKRDQCNKANKKGPSSLEIRMLGPSPRMPHLCEKALHSGFALYDALKAEWDQRLTRQKFWSHAALCSRARSFVSAVINSRSLARTSLYKRVSLGG